MYNTKRKFEQPWRPRWVCFMHPLGFDWARVSPCGSDPLCRQGRARFQIVSFGPYPWCYGGAAGPFGATWVKNPPKPTWTLCNP